MYYLYDAARKQYVSGMVKIIDRKYAVYYRDEPYSGARWATEGGAGKALKRLLDSGSVKEGELRVVFCR